MLSKGTRSNRCPETGDSGDLLGLATEAHWLLPVGIKLALRDLADRRKALAAQRAARSINAHAAARVPR